MQDVECLNVGHFTLRIRYALCLRLQRATISRGTRGGSGNLFGWVACNSQNTSARMGIWELGARKAIILLPLVGTSKIASKLWFDICCKTEVIKTYEINIGFLTLCFPHKANVKSGGNWRRASMNKSMCLKSSLPLQRLYTSLYYHFPNPSFGR